ncbi:helix-turn-helix domain-containing protein [Halomonas elongata]|nr:helix-turn-helix domain-containing protein [Halomonas elongata]
MSDQRAFRGVWIPADIWLSRDLTLQEKVMLVEIDSLQHPEKGCFKSNKALAEFFQLSPNRVSEIIGSLAKKGLVRVEQVRKGKQIVERRIFMATPFEKPKGGSRETEGGYSENGANSNRDLEEGYSENREERGSGFRGSVEGSPPSDARGVFDRAAQQDDQGQPVDNTPTSRQQPMTYDWQPDAGALAMACQRRGMSATTQPDAASLADFVSHFAEQPHQRRTQQGWHERLAKWLAENRQRQPLASTGGPDHAQRSAAHRGDGRQSEREAVREQLANPGDTSWADGWWPEDDATEGADAGAGEPSVHPAGGDFPEDLGECVSECGHAQPGPAGAGAGIDPLAVAADAAGGRAGHERSQASGEYLAADDPGADLDAGADPGGLRYAGDW